ncbi:MAG: sigma 54-interacting transcriptional regulator [Gemmatimonadota bacterium]|nr:MAG: sigma 54-interacting transcriptional regulator [Gemmatimonadota bacterium]
MEKNHLDALLAISQEINSIQKIDPLLTTVMDRAMQALQAERGFLILRDSDSGDMAVKIARNISDESIKDTTEISTSVVQSILKNGQPVLTHDAQEDPRFKGSESVVFHGILSVACVPLRIKEQLIGCIYVDSRSQRRMFTQESLAFLTAFANQAAIAIENAQLYEKLRAENIRLKKEVREKFRFEGIIGQSSKMRQILDIVERISDSDVSVLIQGESGTGKELIARAIHYNGSRKEGPFVAQYCGALTETLLESELFGHKKGSFTGAAEDKKGLFEAADNGTFFLDEIGDISPNIQTKLLRVLQEGEIKRVGETQTRRVDVRIISASNKDLAHEVKKGLFREDLYYRLNVISIHMPPLRERKEDIPLLTQHFFEKYCHTSGKPIERIASKTMDTLLTYHWPGNVRELENTIERAIVLARGSTIRSEDLHIPKSIDYTNEAQTLRDVERNFVLKVLDECDGNKTKAAKRLGVSLRWLHYRLREWEQ